MIAHAQWYEKFMKSSLKRRFIEKFDKLGVLRVEIYPLVTRLPTLGRFLEGAVAFFSVFIYARGEILSCLFGKRIRRTSLE